jgi:geranylgeranyl diphosphate synthase type I
VAAAGSPLDEEWSGRDTKPSAARGEGDAGQRAFGELLKSFRTRLEEALREWLREKQQQVTAGGVAEADELTGNLSEFLFRGGKRLRPALLYYAYKGCGGRSDEAAMALAMAVELLHTYLLIHDDIMDRAELRRGEPSAHVLYRDFHQARGWAGDSSHFGEAVAILLGDLAQAYAVELFASAETESNRRANLVRCYSLMCEEVIVGQYLEMTAGFRQNLTEQELLTVLQMKSGRYSVERPMQLGALLAGASDSILEALAAYGAGVGEAFQLQDDLLGMFGDADRVGKPVGSDLVEGKFTVLIHHTLDRATAEDRQVVLQALGNHDVSAAEVERVQTIIEQCGARRYVVEMVEERMEAALTALSGTDLEPEGEEFLRGLIDYLRGRER